MKRICLKKRKKLTKTLQSICSSLSSLWDERQKENVLEQKVNEVFGDPHDICDLSYDQQFEYLWKRIDSLLDVLPPNQAESIDSVLVTPGFLNWNKFFSSKKSSPINKVYQEWFSSLKTETRTEYKYCIQLFESLQVRVMSEAICETVGSIMASHGARGRNLQPSNFNMELFLRFNLGPLHLLDGLCNEILDTKPKLYHRKLDNSRLDKLISVQSASVANFRKREEEKSKLPPSLWRGK